MGRDFIRQHCYTPSGRVNGRCASASWWEKRGVVELYHSILNETGFLPSPTFALRLYHYMNDLQSILTCKRLGCNNNVRWQSNLSAYSKYCSSKCATKDTLSLREQTVLNRYGVNSTSQLDSVKLHARMTNKSRYGVDNFAKTDSFKSYMCQLHHNMSDEQKKIIQSKREDTCVSRFGYPSVLQSPEIRSKIESTMISRYGVTSALQSAEIVQKCKETNQLRYGRDSFNQSHISVEFLENSKDRSWFESQLATKSIRQLSDIHNVSYSHLCKTLNTHGFDLAQYSSFETEVFNFVQSLYDGEVVRNARVLSNKEIDVFLPSLQIGIECHGVYWHTEIAGKRHRSYHLSKLQVAKSLGIRLIQIFETEWFQKQEIVKNQIRKLFTCNKVYGRKCTVQQVPLDEERKFLEEHHLQGYVKSLCCYGLYLDGMLLQLLSFGPPRYNKGFQWEILRSVVYGNVTVVGGSNRLFARFVKEHKPESVITYSDKRWFTGHSYTRLGFSFLHSSKPNFFYLVGNSLESRIKYQKHKLPKLLKEFDSELSAWQNMQNNGYDRVWDCGNDVWGWHVINSLTVEGNL